MALCQKDETANSQDDKPPVSMQKQDNVLADLRRLKQFPDQLKCIVFGYIRTSFEELFLSDDNASESILSVNAFGMPQLIVLAFYGYRDKWDESAIGEGLKLENNTITKHVDGSWSYRSAFLTNICEDGVHEWTFKVGALHRSWNLIGIWMVNESNIIPTEIYFPERRNDERQGYALNVGAGHLVTESGGSLESDHYCEACKEGDILKMTLDMKQLELRYALNGIDQGVAFSVASSKYRAAICLEGMNTSFELLF